MKYGAAKRGTAGIYAGKGVVRKNDYSEAEFELTKIRRCQLSRGLASLSLVPPQNPHLLDFPPVNLLRHFPNSQALQRESSMAPRARIVHNGKKQAAITPEVPLPNVDDPPEQGLRRSKRSKNSAQQDETTEMDVDTQDVGAVEKGQPSKRKQAAGAGKKTPATRKRANTSDLPAAAPKKVKPADKAGVKKAAKRGAQAAKDDGMDSSEDQIEVVETFADLQMDVEEGEEDDKADDEDSEEGTDDEADAAAEDASDASDYDEGDEKFSNGGDDSEEEGDGEGRRPAVVGTDAAPTKTKAKVAGARKKKNASDQLALAVPTFVEADAEEAPQVTRATVGSHKRATRVVSSDTESGEDNPRQTLQPTLPKRNKGAEAGASASTVTTPASSAPKDIEVVHWQIKGPGAGKVKSKQKAKKASGLPPTNPAPETSQATTASSLQVAPAPTAPAALVPASQAAPAPTAPAAIAPASQAAPAPAAVAASPAQGSRASSAARSQAANAKPNAKVTRSAVATQEKAVIAVAGQDIGDQPGEEMAADEPEDVKPAIGAFTSGTHESWPTDTDLVPGFGGGIGNLGDQKPTVQPVITQANTRELFLVLAFKDFIPEDQSYRNELVREALINAADTLGEQIIAARLRQSKPYATKMGGIPIGRMSTMRGEIKKKAMQSIAAEYNFAGFGGPEKLAVGIAEITSHPKYTHIFPGDHTKRSYDKSLPFCHSAIIASIRATHFVKRPYARLPVSKLTSSITTGPEAEELELPAPLIAFHAVATFASLKDWQAGTLNVLQFDTDAEGPGSIRLAYKEHMVTLRNMKENNLKGYHLITHYLYMMAAFVLSLDDFSTFSLTDFWYSGLIVEDSMDSATSTQANPEVDMKNIGSSLKLQRCS
ncbi:hypothetical protein BV25DRAFT_1922230 [Artomyces pyxidatus]|uniref:Uncharacterized protein n=1 Tax=Artomyces pyxidatus TaxID=48021 RepID=A0ACB8SEI3_9AGAM|nr:hypothetical protein BV25DRAFT_1922230 [Artomyces pyxidatus]